MGFECLWGKMVCLFQFVCTEIYLIIMIDLIGAFLIMLISQITTLRHTGASDLFRDFFYLPPSKIIAYTGFLKPV